MYVCMYDTQVKVQLIGALNISKKMLRNLSEKLGSKLPATALGLPISVMFSQNFLNLKQAQWKVNLCSKKIRKGERGKVQKNLKNEKPKDVGHFLIQKL